MKDVYLKAVYLKAFLVTTKGALKKLQESHISNLSFNIIPVHSQSSLSHATIIFDLLIFWGGGRGGG